MQEIKLGVLHRKRRRKREEGMAKKKGGRGEGSVQIRLGNAALYRV